MRRLPLAEKALLVRQLECECDLRRQGAHENWHRLRAEFVRSATPLRVVVSGFGLGFATGFGTRGKAGGSLIGPVFSMVVDAVLPGLLAGITAAATVDDEVENKVDDAVDEKVGETVDALAEATPADRERPHAGTDA